MYVDMDRPDHRIWSMSLAPNYPTRVPCIAIQFLTAHTNSAECLTPSQHKYHRIIYPPSRARMYSKSVRYPCILQSAQSVIANLIK